MEQLGAVDRGAREEISERTQRQSNSSSSTAAPEAEARCNLQIGSRVKLVSLTGRVELNGKMGRVEGWHAEKQRWRVKIDDGEEVNVYRKNLEEMEEEIEPPSEGR